MPTPTVPKPSIAEQLAGARIAHLIKPVRRPVAALAEDTADRKRALDHLQATGFCVVWTSRAGRLNVTDDHLTRREALQVFDGLREIRRSASSGHGHLRVMSVGECRRLLRGEPR